jgi:hypothetical protein
MRGFFERFSERPEYRLASVALLAGIILPISFVLLIDPNLSWRLLAFVVAGTSYVALAVITYFRLRNASLAGGWLLPMALIFPVGPRWELGSWEWGSVWFQPIGLIALAPLIIGWFAMPSNPEGPTSSEAPRN